MRTPAIRTLAAALPGARILDAAVLVVCVSFGVFAASTSAGEIRFRGEELETRLGVGYAVRLLDMNGDGRLDIAIVDSKRILWLENPSWREHTMIADRSKPHDNVCFAPSDIDGDGDVDFAVGADWQFNNTRSGGTIAWIRNGGKPDSIWTHHEIGEEPTTHRMNFADVDGDGREELIVLPLKGRNTSPPSFDQSGVRILVYDTPEDPVGGEWKPRVIDDDLHVAHNFWPTDLDRDGRVDLLVVSFEGVSLLERTQAGAWKRTRVGAGDQDSKPSRGASEIKHGRLAGGGDYIATIEPWHGNKVVVYTRPDGSRPREGDWLWKRKVLDDRLRWGHAVWCANLDGDPAEELIIGVRDDLDETDRRGVRIYDPRDARGAEWSRQVIDPGAVAVEDLTAGDLDGDGRIDIVAVGRQTHNVKIYWNGRAERKADG